MQEKKATTVTFSDQLHKLMTARNVKQTALARAVGVSHQAIGNYLNGRIPHSAVLMDIAKYFGVDANDLLYGAAGQSGYPVESALHDAEIQGATDELAEIREADHQAFRTVREVITTYHRTVRRKKADPHGTQPIQGVSSEVASVAEGGQASASALAKHEPQESGRSPGAGGPIGRKRGRGHGVGQGKKGPPGTPGQAPK